MERKVIKKRRPTDVNDTKRDTGENTTKSDGANLGMGSSEYREMVADRSGLDEFEQEEAKLAEAGLRQNDEQPEADKWHEDRAKAAAEAPAKASEARATKDAERLSTTERNVQNQIRKMSMRGGIIARGLEMAEATDSPDDDKKMRRRLPKALDEQTYNEGASYDDYYPGSRTIKRFLD